MESGGAPPVCPLGKASTERYSRQLLVPDVGVDGHARIEACSVLVVGAGGLGSPCALYLAGAGLLYSRYRSLSLKLSDIRVYEPRIRARLGTTAHFGAGAAPWFPEGGSHLVSRRGEPCSRQILSLDSLPHPAPSFLKPTPTRNPQERGCPFPGDGGVRTSVSFL